MPPLVFSPQNSRMLYFGTQYALKTTNDGATWQRISPDLTARDAAPAARKRKSGKASGHQLEDEFSNEPQSLRGRRQRCRAERFRTSSPLACRLPRSRLRPSPLACCGPAPATGSCNSLPTPAPPGRTFRRRSKTGHHGQHHRAVALRRSHRIRSGHQFSRSGALHLRTRDGGKSWQKITQASNPAGIARVVREDPVRKGLLYAGT